MEVEIEPELEPGPIVRRLPPKPDFRSDIEQDRQVRPKASCRKLLEAPELVNRYAHYASRDRNWPPKRHSVSPV